MMLLKILHLQLSLIKDLHRIVGPWIERLPKRKSISVWHVACACQNIEDIFSWLQPVILSPCCAERGMKKDEEIRGRKVERARCLRSEIHLSRDGFPTESFRLCPPFSPSPCVCVCMCVCQEWASGFSPAISPIVSVQSATYTLTFPCWRAPQDSPWTSQHLVLVNRSTGCSFSPCQGTNRKRKGSCQVRKL